MARLAGGLQQGQAFEGPGSTNNVGRLRALQLRAAAVLAACCFVIAATSGVALLLFGWLIIPGLLLLELIVWPIVFYFKYRQLNAQPLVHAPPPSYNPRDVFDRFTRGQAKLSKYLCIQQMLRKWFWNVPISEIKKGNVADLLTYGFWYKSRAQLEAEGQGHLPDQLVQEIEQAWGVQFAEGYNERLRFMAHLWQGLRCHYRPMTFYLGIEMLFAIKHVMLLGTGFSSYSHRGYTFYTYGMQLGERQRVHPFSTAAAPDAQVPILFLHGVGIGLLPYAPFVFRLAAAGQPLLAIESSHLGMRWVSHCPSEDEVAEAIDEILDQCKITTAAVVGHSYGTFLASRLLQRFPQRIQSLVLIDPVCFVMFSGKLILNFVYEPHKTAVTTWFVARDIHHTASVCRNFFWSLLNLWPDQLPDKTLVVLSGQDELVPVEETITMLKESKAEVLYHTHHCHAEFIKDLPWQDKVVSNVIRLASNADSNGPSQQAAPSTASNGSSCQPSSGSLPLHSAHSELASAEQLDSQLPRLQASTEEGTSGARRRAGAVRQQHERMDSASSWQGATSSSKQQQQICSLPVL